MTRLFCMLVPVFCFGLLANSAAELQIDIVYDNTSVARGIEADWGFAAFVQYRGNSVLFDSGTKPEMFMKNLEKMGIAPEQVTHAVISHEHGDHINGIYRLFPENPKMEVFFLDVFPAERYSRAQQVGMKPVRVTGPREIAPGIFTTGVVEGPAPEQALVIDTDEGLVIVTGCSHPGVEKLVAAARRQRGKDEVRLLVGGFHMTRHSDEQVREVMAKLKAMNVKRIIPTHCTGERAIEIFRKEFGPGFEQGGAGKRLVLE